MAIVGRLAWVSQFEFRISAWHIEQFDVRGQSARVEGHLRCREYSITKMIEVMHECRQEVDKKFKPDDVRFSNRPFGVKHFQTIHQCGVDVAHGLVLLFGIGTKALPLWDPRTRRNNLLGGLAVNRMAGPSGHANSPHPSSREGHLSTARWSSSFLLSGLILNGFHAAAAACSRVHRNSVPSTQMRCMITASRRARATIAFFIPRRLAICMAHALSQDHFFECIML
jgi:hypothetical protein